MKKITSMILSLCMILAIVATMGISVAAAPEGTAINSAADFAAMAADGKYYLNADITLDATYANEFTGTLDGNGKTITVSAPAFDKLAGTVKNLTIKGAIDVSAAPAHGAALAATVTGKTLIDGVKNEASVKGYVTAGDGPEIETVSKGRKPGAAGIVGVALAEITISNCVNTGAINGYAAGGIIGLTDGEFPVEILNCENFGTITNEGVTANVGDGNGSIAGIIGCINRTVTTTIDGCVNNGEIKAIYKQATGGIVGGAWRTPATSCKEQTCVVIKNCVNNGAIDGGWQTGGIAGWMRINVSIENCINNATVSSNQSYSGGIIGRAGDTAKGGYIDQTDSSAGSITLENTDKYTKLYIKKCINNGAITSFTGQTGGFVGYGETPIIISDSINNGSVGRREGSDKDLAAGGFIGACKGALSVTNCINNGAISGQAATGGIVGNITNPKIDSSNFSVYGAYTVHGCVNNGAIVGEKKDTGGIIGYAYGTGICYADVQNCINTATIQAGAYGSQFVGYTNNNSTTVMNCVGTGSVTAKEERSVFIGLSSATVTDYRISGNYIAEGHGMTNYSYADSNDNAKNRIALADAPAGAFTVVPTAMIPTVVTTVNTLLGANVYEIKDGKVAFVCTHNYLNETIEAIAPTCTAAGKAAGSKCLACGTVTGCEEVAAIAHTYADGKCTACGAADPAAGPDVSGPTGDSAVIYIAVAVLAVLGTTVVAKKREN